MLVYYGLHVHEEVLKKGVKVTGATVHYVDEGMDTGEIIFQKQLMYLILIHRRLCKEELWSRQNGSFLPAAINMIANKDTDKQTD